MNVSMAESRIKCYQASDLFVFYKIFPSVNGLLTDQLAGVSPS